MHFAVTEILKHFTYEHLPPHLQAVSKRFHDMAWEFANDPDIKGPELTAGLRKLLEAKDCMVRARR